MEIFVTVKSVYGNSLVYPACDKSKLLAELIGKKTFDRQSLFIIKSLGYIIVIKHPEMELV